MVVLFLQNEYTLCAHHIESDGIAFVMVYIMPIHLVFKTVVFSKRKFLYNKLQIMFGQALFANTNALFKIFA